MLPALLLSMNLLALSPEQANERCIVVADSAATVQSNRREKGYSKQQAKEHGELFIVEFVYDHISIEVEPVYVFKILMENCLAIHAVARKEFNV